MDFNNGTPGEIGEISKNQLNYNRPQKNSSGWKIFLAIMLTISVLINVIMFVLLIAVGTAAAIGSGGQTDIYIEKLIEEGPAQNKVAVINLVGIINYQSSNDIRLQIKAAKEDDTIKALILRVNSPGGAVSSSDQIYNEIIKYKNETNKPVIAFTQGLAASGGYYASVACDTIIAEPTTITGSIGVIMAYMVLEELLENKLGIKPVIIKSGERKDWPSTFRVPSEQELKYLDESIIKPAYDRFVSLVNDGRPDLSLEQVKILADGSIFSAQKALDEKLIDEIGYLDKAINTAKEMANIKEAKVIEYQRPFSLASLLSSYTPLKIDRSSVYEFSRPEIMYLWQGID